MDLPGYDAWKLATPPEYEMTGEEEAEIERRRAEDRIDELTQEDETPAILAEIASLREFLATEPCPNCNVEWADQYLGECDICNGARRVRRFDCPSEAEIGRSQAAIGAVLGPDADHSRDLAMNTFFQNPDEAREHIRILMWTAKTPKEWLSINALCHSIGDEAPFSFSYSPYERMVAVTRSDWDLGMPSGMGRTEAEAIADLLEQEECK